MKLNTKKIMLVGAAVAAPLLFANANAAPIQGDASAEIIAALTLSQSNAGLDFGSIVADATGGTVTMSQAGTRDCGTLVCAAQDPGAAAAFAVSGQANYGYAITLPSTAFTISNGTNTMDVTVTGPATGTLDATGNGTFSVGGSLSVTANQAAGAYSGQFPVEVAYN